MPELTMACLRQGECGIVDSLNLYSGQRRRMQELGLLPGTVVCCAHIAPSGSPMAFRIRGALIALRPEDCRHVEIRRDA